MNQLPTGQFDILSRIYCNNSCHFVDRICCKADYCSVRTTSRSISHSWLTRVDSPDSLCFYVFLLAEKLKWICFQNWSSSKWSISALEYVGGSPLQKSQLLNVPWWTKHRKFLLRTTFGSLTLFRSGMVIVIVRWHSVFMDNSGGIVIGGDDWICDALSNTIISERDAKQQ